MKNFLRMNIRIPKKFSKDGGQDKKFSKDGGQDLDKADFAGKL